MSKKTMRWLCLGAVVMAVLAGFAVLGIYQLRFRVQKDPLDQYEILDAGQDKFAWEFESSQGKNGELTVSGWLVEPGREYKGLNGGTGGDASLTLTSEYVFADRVTITSGTQIKYTSAWCGTGGDSGYGKHYAEIGEKYGPFDFAALEIDAWNGGWPDIHLFPEQAVRAAKDLKAKTMLPIHWSVYDLGFHPWDKSIKRVAEIAEREGMPLATPKQGEKYITEKTKTSKWWEE